MDWGIITPKNCNGMKGKREKINMSNENKRKFMAGIRAIADDHGDFI